MVSPARGARGSPTLCSARWAPRPLCALKGPKNAECFGTKMSLTPLVTPQGLMRRLCGALHERFAAQRRPSTTFIAHVDEPVRSHVDGRGRLTRELLPPLRLGEADVAVAHWVRMYPRRTVVVRVLDSDHIPISLLTAHSTRRRSPLYVWLRSRGESSPGAMCDEPRDVLCVRSLLERLGTCPVTDFCLFVACQQTDFVRKVVQNLNAKKTMDRVLASYARGDVKKPFATCDRDVRTCDVEGATRFLRSLAAAANRASLVRDAECEVRRAWWNVMYWAVPDPPPCEEYGWRA